MKLDFKKKFNLFKQNQNFCSAPWNLLYIGTQGEIKICVLNHTVAGNLHTDSLEDIISSEQRRAIKATMLADQPVESCKNCKHLENQIDQSSTYGHLRNMYNELFVMQDIDYTDLDEFKFGALDLHWSSICDLKCVTCWPAQSSSLAVEQGVPIFHTKSDVILPLIDKIVKNQASLKEVYLSGGEPTLIKYNLNLLSQLEKRPDLRIRINSNMMWEQDNSIIQEVIKFPNVLFTCSADNIGSKFEYIRRGASWDRFDRNLRFLQQHSNIEIRINSVFFVLSALELIDTINYFAKHYNIDNFTINQCGMGQTHLRCRNLSDILKERVKNNIQQAIINYSNNQNLIGQFTNCLEELTHIKTENYLDYFVNIDKLQGSSFEKTFLELI